MEKRRTFRQRTRAAAYVLPYRPEEEEQGEQAPLPEPQVGVVLDISVGGLQLRCRTPFQQGDRISVQQVRLEPEGEAFDFLCEVRWVRYRPERDDWLYGCLFAPPLKMCIRDSLSNLANSAWTDWDTNTEANNITSIGNCVAQGSDELTLRRVFSDSIAPNFATEFPTFDPITDVSVTMNVMLDRAGTVFYMVAPLGTVTSYLAEPKDNSGVIDLSEVGRKNYLSLPEDGKGGREGAKLSKMCIRDRPGGTHLTQRQTIAEHTLSLIHI